MRRVLILVAVLIGAGIGFSVSSQDAIAGPLPGVPATVASPSLVEKAGYWRRYCRRYGCGPDVILPEAEVDVDVTADVDAPAIVVLPPPRPLSCGQYRYWNGERCVDARYNDPYLGPK